jgi:redox-sensitive bicupin YhaK (pirin superfamily)
VSSVRNPDHGKAIPGFPQHPHRGFETITLVRRGLIDHTDSSGAAARFGEGGDVQWMTAGKGIVHCEMFPLLKKDDGNPAELFQVWLNLPAKRKMVHPHFTMFWHEKIPRGVMKDEEGRETEVVVIANGMSDQMPWGEKVEGPKPPPDSWASDPEANGKLVPHSQTTRQELTY